MVLLMMIILAVWWRGMVTLLAVSCGSQCRKA